MKTPRELLLARHRVDAPDLDAIRATVLRTELATPSAPAVSLNSSICGFLVQAWQELFWANRRAFAGLAAAWVTILAVNWHLTEAGGEPLAAQDLRTPSFFLWTEASARLLAETPDLTPPPPAPRSDATRPQSRLNPSTVPLYV
jgi:hypothetical protein